LALALQINPFNRRVNRSRPDLRALITCCRVSLNMSAILASSRGNSFHNAANSSAQISKTSQFPQSCYSRDREQRDTATPSASFRLSSRRRAGSAAAAPVLPPAFAETFFFDEPGGIGVSSGGKPNDVFVLIARRKRLIPDPQQNSQLTDEFVNSTGPPDS
jgi:hypothetical protein